MKRIGDLSLFRRLDPGNVATFDGERVRTVRFIFNAPHRTAINVVAMGADGSFGEGDPMFLCVVDGLEEVQFQAEGPFGLEAEATVYIKTAEGETIHFVEPDAVTFTRIAERRARNPELEHMQRVLMLNQERRMGAMFEELRAREASLEERSNDLGTRSSGGDSPAPEQADSGGKPAPSPAPAPGGKTASTDDA